MAREVDDWMKLARSKGWTVKRTSQGHIQWCPPDGASLVITSNPAGRHNNSRNLQRIKAQLKTAGLFNAPAAKLTVAPSKELTFDTPPVLWSPEYRHEVEQLATQIQLDAIVDGVILIEPAAEERVHEVAMPNNAIEPGKRYTMAEDEVILKTVGKDYYNARLSGERVPLDNYNGVAARLGRSAESVQSRVGYLWQTRRLHEMFGGPEEPPENAPVPIRPSQEINAPEWAPITIGMDTIAPALATLEAMVFELADNHAALKRRVEEEMDTLTRGMQASIAELRGKVHKLSPTEGNEFVTKVQLAEFVKTVDARLAELQRSADPLAPFRQRLGQ